MNFTKKIVASALILINFLLLHYIISSLPVRFDLTGDGVFTLSDSSKSLISKIEEPVAIDFYTSRSLTELPAAFKNFAVRVEKLLGQYERASNGMIRLNIIDPKPDTTEEEMAIAAGLKTPEVQSGDKVFLGIVVTQGDSEKTIPFFDWNKEEFIEYNISKAIYEAQQFTKPKIGLITTLPLKAPAVSMPGQTQQPDQYFVQQLETSFEIEAIEPTASRLPNDIDLLAIVHPKNLNEGLQYEIDQFALAGKPIFLALDPSSIIDREKSRQMQQMQMMGGNISSQQASSELAKLTETWGIDYDPNNVVIDPNNSIAQANFANPSWLLLQKDTVNHDLLPTSNIDAVIMPEAGSLAPSETATTTWTPILTTSSETGKVPGMILQFSQPDQLMSQSKPVGNSVAIAGLLSGEALSAYPDGDPLGSEEDEQATHLASGEINVFIVSDTDWLLDQFSIQRSNFFGMQSIQKLNDNATLSANVIEFIGGSRDLIGIRSKKITPSEFDVVKKMEAEAQQAYQAKLEVVEEKLADISQKISKLIGEQQGGGFIVATPEISAILQENRDQEVKLRAESREIRRNLRQGIERLGNWVGAINLLWAPIGLALFGVSYNRMRKRG